MTRYDTSKTSPDFSPPPRGLGRWTWLVGIVVIAAVILGVFLWNGLGGQPGGTVQSGTTSTPGPTAAR
jgi:hypothetical protein